MSSVLMVGNTAELTADHRYRARVAGRDFSRFQGVQHVAADSREYDHHNQRPIALDSFQGSQKLIGEPVAEAEENNCPGDGANRIHQHKSQELQLENPGHQKYGSPHSRDDSSEEDNSQAILVVILLDFMTLFFGKEFPFDPGFFNQLGPHIQPMK